MADYLKKAIFAVAGAGKTTMLVNSLSPNKRTLLLTYTDNNAENLYNAIINKFGYIPDNIMVSTWFSFILNFLLRPFIIQETPYIDCLIFPKAPPRYANGLSRYIANGNAVFHSRAFEFCQTYVGVEKIINRLKTFFDEVLIDEVQDFAGYDFDFIELLGKIDINAIITGDFFQHTYDTSRDGSKNKNLHDNFESYKNRLQKYYQIDLLTLSNSYRCPNEICIFVRDKIGINMNSFSKRTDISYPTLLTDSQEIKKIMDDKLIIKLFYREHYKYCCNSDNWGGCKGLSYDNVCVILNKSTLVLFKKEKINELSPTTRNKFYVACTRTKGNLFFIDESDIKQYKIQ